MAPILIVNGLFLFCYIEINIKNWFIMFINLCIRKQNIKITEMLDELINEIESM